MSGVWLECFKYHDYKKWGTLQIGQDKTNKHHQANPLIAQKSSEAVFFMAHAGNSKLPEGDDAGNAHANIKNYGEMLLQPYENKAK